MTVKIRAAACLFILTTSVLGQVPAGVPYEPQKHPNPIVTWVNEKDFKKVSFAEAADKVGVELLTLSRNEGERVSVEVASPASGKQRIRILNDEYEVTFYAVMRQNYKLKSNNNFTLYTFRYPRTIATADVLNQAAFGRPPRGTVPRFGALPVPDRIDIREVPGLYFDNGKLRSIYWFERGAGFSVTTDAPKDELLRVLNDLL